jgi:Leucine-rich repeat (LRR) protein
LTILYLNFNLITRIEDDSFPNTTDLNDLYLSGNRIKIIERSSFLKLAFLTRLDLSFNRLTILDYETFAGLNNLNVLNMSSNSIEFVQRRLFRDLFNLIKLDLSGNQILSIESESFASLTYLKYLNLNLFRVNVTSIFSRLNSIKELVLRKETAQNLDIKAILRPIVQYKVLNMDCYGSINVIYSKAEYTDLDCVLVLKAMRFKVHINPKDDLSENLCRNYCSRFSLNQLKELLKKL